MQTRTGRVRSIAFGSAPAGGLAMVRPALAIITPITCDQAALAAVAPSNTFIDTAAPIAAVDTLPAYCNVIGHYVDSLAGATSSPNNVNFQLALPDPAVWNGK